MSAKELPARDWRRTVYGNSRISGATTRKTPRLGEKAKAKESQGNRCLYCEIPIGTTIWRHSRSVTLQPAWDHFVPYSYLARNPDNNWVLACHVCNGIKSCGMFQSVQDARVVILPRRIAKGYESPIDVLFRIGMKPEDDPWPLKIRVAKSAKYHLARPLHGDVLLTACRLEVGTDRGREIYRHQLLCTYCSLKRDVPVVPQQLAERSDPQRPAGGRAADPDQGGPP